MLSIIAHFCKKRKPPRVHESGRQLLSIAKKTARILGFFVTIQSSTSNGDGFGLRNSLPQGKKFFKGLGAAQCAELNHFFSLTMSSYRSF
jgi:hypothetical protein